MGMSKEVKEEKIYCKIRLINDLQNKVDIVTGNPIQIVSDGDENGCYIKTPIMSYSDCRIIEKMVGEWNFKREMKEQKVIKKRLIVLKEELKELL